MPRVSSRQAQGQNELAVYLNGLPTPTRPAGSQGLIAPESLDFTNLPARPSCLSGFVYVDANHNGHNDSGDGTNPRHHRHPHRHRLTGNSSPIATTTDSTGAYGFTSLPPGTPLHVTETQPAGISRAPTPASPWRHQCRHPGGTLPWWT